MNKEEFREASLSLQARVNVIPLAELAKYWGLQNYNIKSISQLVNWSIELLKDILVENSAIVPEFDFISARQYLVNRGLTQQSLDKVNLKKIAAATRMSGLRKEGLDPRIHAPMDYRALNNSNSVESLPDAYSQERLARQAEIHEQYKKEMNEKIAIMKKQGGIVSSSNEAEIIENDKQLNNDLDELIRQQMKGRE